VIRSIALNSVPEKLARLLMEWTAEAQENNGVLRVLAISSESAEAVSLAPPVVRRT
jgi:hypothetical protein